VGTIDFTTGTKEVSEADRKGGQPAPASDTLRVSVVNVFDLMTSALLTVAQNPTPSTDTLKKRIAGRLSETSRDRSFDGLRLKDDWPVRDSGPNRPDRD